MTGYSCKKRVAIFSDAEQAAALLALFHAKELQDWQAFITEGCEHAHFVVQMEACDVVLVDDSGLAENGADDLALLTIRHKSPVVLLSDAEAKRVIQALGRGVQHWLPRTLVLEHPAVLAAALSHAVLGCVPLRRANRAGEELRDCRSQVTRLANLLWEATPILGRPRWSNQRYLLERLHEEVTRTERHGSPLSLVIGELRFRADGCASGDSPLSGPLHEWAIELISRNKRAADVAGQYGPDGFMIVLPHTSSAGADTYCRRLCAMLQEAPSSIGPATCEVRACLGTASHSDAARTAQSLLRQAEEQLDAERAETCGSRSTSP